MFVTIQSLFLVGGFEAFHKRYSYLCEGSSVVPVIPNMLGANMREMNLSSPCEHKHAHSIENISRPTQVLPFLYIGNAQNAADKLLLRQLGVTAILNVSDCSPPDCSFDYMQISILDNHQADLLSHLNSAIKFIGEFSTAKFLYSIIFRFLYRFSQK